MFEIIVNNESIHEQYSEEEFYDFCAKELIPILNEIQKNNGSILSDYNFYQKHITKQYSFFDLWKIHGNPIIDRLKVFLVQLTQGPYWEDDCKTDSKKVYKCLINDIPNCITETYERNGILFSFKDERFCECQLEIFCNGEEQIVRNFDRLAQLILHLEELGYIITWKDNSFEVESLGYKFEIRFREDNHKQAHFHMSNADDAVVLSIPDADIMKGNARKTKEIIAWSLNNMDKIVMLWNQYHPDKKVEFK